MSRKLILAVIVTVTLLYLLVAGSKAVEVKAIFASSPTPPAPTLIVKSPNNYTTYKEPVPLNFTIDYVVSDPNTLIWNNHIRWIEVSINNNSFITIINQTSPPATSSYYNTFSKTNSSYNAILNSSKLSDGQHKIEITVEFTYFIEQTNVGTYNYTFAPIYFTISTMPTPSPTNSPIQQPTVEPTSTATITPTCRLPPSDSFPLTTIIIAIVGVACVGALGALIYFKKVKK